MVELLPNPSAIALYFLMIASQQVKIVLSGESADELFGGCYYREPLDFAKYMRLPQGLRNMLGGIAEKNALVPARGF